MSVLDHVTADEATRQAGAVLMFVVLVGDVGGEDVGVVGAAQQFVAQDGVLPDAFEFVKLGVDKQHADVVQEAACGELA